MTRWVKYLTLAVAMVVLVAAGASAKDALSFGTPTTGLSKMNPNVRTVTVPLNITNDKNLAAIDIPLQFAEVGDNIDLLDVKFDEGRAHYFDVRVANIDNENKTVIIGLLWMAYNPDQPELESGEGPLAQMTFEVGEDVNEITLSPTTFKNPSHSLSFIYNDVGADGMIEVKELVPEFNGYTIPLTSAAPIPTDWSLSQNYPNPFNASTVISFGLPNDAQVRLDVYNILGQRVTTLKDEWMSAGNHQATWNSDKVASGVYFYRLMTDEFTKTRKMTLMK